PEKYPGHQPLATSLPDLLPMLGSEWKQIDDNVLGEWYTYLVLAHGWQPHTRLATVTGRQAAAGWAGDRYRVYHNPASQQTVLIQRWLWENSTEADEFWNAFQNYAKFRWGVPATRADSQLTWTGTPDGEVTLLHYSRETLWLIAPNAAISAAIMDELDAHLEQDS
ncbi:MAG: hypothetical protein U1B80_04210, partial [Anaerolineaceae bacterium]|nr:hypothetical protein [Anaerolineaceae bacterium]